MGPWCKEVKEWLNQLGQEIVYTKGYVEDKKFLMQRIRMKRVQRGNFACVAASMPASECLDIWSIIYRNKYEMYFIC